MDKKFDVAIVGLGPVGSLLALLLNKAGLSVLGIDKDREIFQLPRAVTINDEGLRIMQRLGMEDIYLENSKIKSNNWTDSGTTGTELNLNDGTFKMGGDTNPNLSFDV